MLRRTSLRPHRRPDCGKLWSAQALGKRCKPRYVPALLSKAIAPRSPRKGSPCAAAFAAAYYHRLLCCFFFLPALAHINPAFAGGKCGQLITRELNCAVGTARRGEYGVEPLKGDIHIDLSRPFRQGKGHTPPTACPVRRSTSSGASIVAFLPKKSLNFRLSILASPAATIKIQVSPLTKERVFAIRAGSVPSASAASATVALEESNSWMRPSRPCSFKNALTVSIAIVTQSEYAPLAFLSILYFMLQVPQPAATHPPSAQLPAFCHHGFHSPAPCAPLLPTGCAARLKIRPHRGPARQM